MEEKLKSYRYKVYGLDIESEIEIEEFIYNEEETERGQCIKIMYGELPENIQEKMGCGKYIELSNGYIWFHIEHVATYCIEDGEKIIVIPCENADMQLLKVYLMCSCLGFIMLQRNQVAIHGGTVEMGNKAVIITGDRGAGKSTLTTALRRKGYKFLSDDVAAAKINETPMIQHGFPYQKLCEDAMNQMGYDKSSYQSFCGDSQIKYMVPAQEQFVEEERPLTAIVEICKGTVDNVKIEQIKGQEKLAHIMKNIYRGEYISALGGMKSNYMKQCIDIAKNISFYRMTRPQVGFTLDEQISCLEKIVL